MINEYMVYSSIYGGIVGDAIGVPYEFLSRDILRENPITTMDGYGTYNMPPGTWSDDSSLALASLDSLSDGIDYEDMMNNFVGWYANSEYTPEGILFDIGATTKYSIERYIDGTSPLDCGGSGVKDNGNGSLMRIMPFVLYVSHHKLSKNEMVKIINEASSLTHAHHISKVSCNIYNFICQEIINNKDDLSIKELIINGVDVANNFYQKQDLNEFNRILNLEIFDLKEDDILSGGYVLTSLEASLYSFINSTNYKDAVLTAVNLGNDTDTIGMITGGLAGLYYGYDNIPKEWIETLINKELIDKICNKFISSL